jgi:hypothetical protein
MSESLLGFTNVVITDLEPSHSPDTYRWGLPEQADPHSMHLEQATGITGMI